MDADDIWGDGEPDALQKIKRDHSNAGYLEGVTEAKLKAHQPGFDEGYSEGAALGLAVGKILGDLQAHGLTELEEIAANDMAPQKLFSSEFYDADSKPKFSGTEHPLINQWRKRCETLLTSQLP